MSVTSIEIHRSGATTRLTLARPEKGNCLSAMMVRDIGDALDTCYADGTQALLIDAQGRHFCTGFDLSDLETETDDSLLCRFVRLELMLQKIYRAPFPTAAVAHGKSWGAGADLFASCTWRSADPGATFAFPGAGFGLILGTGRLAGFVGQSSAVDWIMTGRTITAPEAIVAGLVLKITERQKIEKALADLSLCTRRLDSRALAQVRLAASAQRESDDAIDLAHLVRSASGPGLKKRIMAYRAALERPHAIQR